MNREVMVGNPPETKVYSFALDQGSPIVGDKGDTITLKLVDQDSELYLAVYIRGRSDNPTGYTLDCRVEGCEIPLRAEVVIYVNDMRESHVKVYYDTSQRT